MISYDSTVVVLLQYVLTLFSYFSNCFMTSSIHL